MNDNNDLTNFLDAPKPGLKQIVYTFNVKIGKLVCKIISTKYGDNLPSPNIVKIDEVSKLKLRNSTHGLEHQLHHNPLDSGWQNIRMENIAGTGDRSKNQEQETGKWEIN